MCHIYLGREQVQQYIKMNRNEEVMGQQRLSTYSMGSNGSTKAIPFDCQHTVWEVGRDEQNVFCCSCNAHDLFLNVHTCL